MTTPRPTGDSSLPADSSAYETRAVRAGMNDDAQHGAVVPPIYLTSTFAFDGFNGKRTYDYTRSGNPTRTHLAQAITELEHGTSGVVTASGMAAIALVLHLARPGDVIVAPHDCYGGTHRLLTALSRKGHFDLALVALTSESADLEIARRRPRFV